VQQVFGIKSPAIDWEIDASAVSSRIEEEQKLIESLSAQAQQLIGRARALEEAHPELVGAFDARIRELEALLEDGSAEELSGAVAAFEAFVSEKELSAGGLEETPPPDDGEPSSDVLEETPPPDEEDAIAVDDGIPVGD